MHPVLRTVLQRLGLGLVTLFVVSIIIFSSVEMLPGDFAKAILGQSATPETVAAFEKRDRPRPPAGRALPRMDRRRRCTATSAIPSPGRRRLSSAPSPSLIAPRLYNTLFLAMMAASSPCRCRWSLGMLAALYRNSFFDRIVNS